MALFKLRKKVDEPVAASGPAESIEAMRRRARHRLIGAAVLVLAGVIGFPLLFDTQPRPVSVDIPIEIPDRNKVKPLPAPSQSPAASGLVSQAASAPPAPARAAAPASSTGAEAKPAPVAAAPEAKTAPPEKLAKAQSVEEPRPQAKPEARPAAPSKVAEARPSADDAARARALLEGKTVDTAADTGRYVVQVGAFAEKAKAHQAQVKLQRAGLKNYTQVADTGDGKRIRVRAGPFASRAEADKAAEKIKSLDLPVRILAL